MHSLGGLSPPPDHGRLKDGAVSSSPLFPWSVTLWGVRHAYSKEEQRETCWEADARDRGEGVGKWSPVRIARDPELVREESTVSGVWGAALSRMRLGFSCHLIRRGGGAVLPREWPKSRLKRRDKHRQGGLREGMRRRCNLEFACPKLSVTQSLNTHSRVPMKDSAGSDNEKTDWAGSRRRGFGRGLCYEGGASTLHPPPQD